MMLGIDYGSRYVGLAITDPEEKLALRHGVVDRKQNDVLDEIGMIIEDENIATVVIGVPRSLSGKESDQTHTTLAFVEDVRERFPEVNIETVDETFTSKEAERIIRAEGGKLEEAHSEAARLMLESYIIRKT